MTTEREVGILCKWFQKMSDRNVCWISSRDIEETERIQYCVGNWRECELYQKEARLEPLLKVRRGD